MGMLSMLLRRSRAVVILAAVAGVLSGGATVAIIAILQRALLQQGAGGVRLILAFVVAGLTVLVAGAVSSVLIVRLAQQSIQALRVELCGKILDTSLMRIEAIGPSRLLAALTDDVMVITNAVQTLPLLVVNVAIVIGALVYIGILSLLAMGAMLLVMAAGIALYRLPMARASRHLRAARRHQDTLHGHLEAITRGIKELKLSQQRRQAVVGDGVRGVGAAMVERIVRGMTLHTIAGSWGQLLFLAVVGVMLFAGPLLGVGQADLTGFTMAVLYINTPLVTLLNVVPALGRASVALSAISSLSLGDEPTGNEEPADHPAKRGERVELRGVRYSYPGTDDETPFQLGPVNATFDPGTITFIVGGNGSGKTTLAKLVCGLYPPHDGEVAVSGQRLRTNTADVLRAATTAVFSDVFLFQALPRAEADATNEARRLLAGLGMDNKVGIEDGRFSTIALSTGQRKRLALIAALLEQRPVLLFDEWAADQDPEFRQYFYMELLPELRSHGKTVVAITHDDRYFNVADNLLKLERGTVVYHGTPTA